MTGHPTREDEDVPAPTEERDWEWRRWIRSNPHAHRLYRLVVALVGLLITVVGLVLVPAPGPGWLVVLLGLAVLASEFAWARRVLHFARRTLDAWADWVKAQPWWVKALVSLATLVLLLALAYAYLRWQGPPGLLPDDWEHWLTTTFSL